MHIKIFLSLPLLRLLSPGLLSKGIHHHMNFIFFKILFKEFFTFIFLYMEFLILWEIVLGDIRLRKQINVELETVMTKHVCVSSCQRYLSPISQF